MTGARLACVMVTVAAAACGSGPAIPAQLDTAHDMCGYCRMIVSDRRFASQIAAPLEEPKFFDDLTCLANYLRSGARIPPRAVVYVTDHSTLRWVRAEDALFTRVNAVSAPMGSRIVVHESAATRSADPAAASGTPVSRADVLPAGFPGGSR